MSWNRGRGVKLRSRPLWPAGSVPVQHHASGTWLVSCERAVAASDLARELALVDPAVFEVSALEWRDERTALDGLIVSVGGPNVFAGNWDALNDGLADLPAEALVIVRDIDPRHEPWLAKFVAIFDPDPSRGRANGRRVLALEGWRHPNVEELTPTAWQADLYEVRQVAGSKDDRARE